LSKRWPVLTRCWNSATTFFGATGLTMEAEEDTAASNVAWSYSDEEEACMVGMEEEEEEMGEDGRGRKKGRGFSGRYADRLFLVFLPPLSLGHE